MRFFLLVFACAACADPSADSGFQPGGKADVGEEGSGHWMAAPPKGGNLRIATFNIRNFPEVALAAEQSPPLSYRLETDVEVLKELLATLQFDVLAVQEIRDTDALSALLAELGGSLGRSFDARFSENESGNDQHIGIVIDADKLSFAWTREHPEVDVSSTLRPALTARIESTAVGGADFTVMVLHLASGDSNKRQELRAQQALIASQIAASEVSEMADDDFIVLGDLNTAGGDEELPSLDAAFANGIGLGRAPNATGCTAYWVKKSTNPLVRPSWLDHAYWSSLEERDEAVPVLSGAHCTERHCVSFESTNAETGGSFYSVSDHCPVYFEVRDEDLD